MKVYDFNTVRGGQIGVPGLYIDVPIDLYHSGDLCVGPSVSSTGLKRVRKAPALFWAHSPWNPEREPQEARKPLDEGKAAHLKVFQPELFDAQCAVLPDELSSLKGDGKTRPTGGKFLIEEAKLWKEAMVAEGKTVLVPAQVEMIDRMAATIRRDPDAVALFSDGLPELTIAARDDATGLWLLARPDFLPSSPARGSSDYKTCVSAEPDKWGYDAFKLGYHIQIGLIDRVLELIEGARRPTHWMLAQEKTAPFIATTFRWPEELIQKGRDDVRGALDRLAYCRERNRWPGYAEGPVDVEAPYSIRKEIEGLAA